MTEFTRGILTVELWFLTLCALEVLEVSLKHKDRGLSFELQEARDVQRDTLRLL